MKVAQTQDAINISKEKNMSLIGKQIMQNKKDIEDVKLIEEKFSEIKKNYSKEMEGLKKNIVKKHSSRENEIDLIIKTQVKIYNAYHESKKLEPIDIENHNKLAELEEKMEDMHDALSNILNSKIEEERIRTLCIERIILQIEKIEKENLDYLSGLHNNKIISHTQKNIDSTKYTLKEYAIKNKIGILKKQLNRVIPINKSIDERINNLNKRLSALDEKSKKRKSDDYSIKKSIRDIEVNLNFILEIPNNTNPEKSHRKEKVHAIYNLYENILLTKGLLSNTKN